MKRRVLALMTALSLLLVAVMPASATWDEEEDEELFAPGSSLVQGKDEEEKTETEGALDDLNQSNASNIGAMGQKDWAALAKAAANTGKWRDDFVAVAESQLGYAANADGTSIYGDEADGETSWTALFLRWAAEKAGFGRHFPKGDTYDALLKAMKNIKAVKKISRSSYPAGGDIALIEKNGEKLFAVVIYVSNGYASLILADDNGKVTREVYQVSGKEFKQFIDLTVLMDRAGVETGKGGDAPQIPAGGIAAWTNTNAVYMRSEPTTASKRVTTVKKSGTALIVTGAEKQQDGYIWYSVEYGKYRGYIRGDLLKLDQSALPTQAPAATFTPAPTVAPAATAEPGCALCAAAAGRYALPEECCYAHLLTMDEAARSRFMASLQSGDPATFGLFIDCHSAHTAAGDKALLCLGDACGEHAWTVPGPAHAQDCPWHAAFAVQDRVVNIVIHQPASADGVLPGEQVTFTYEVYGAAAYQWYQVKTETAGDAVKETITLLPGETGTTLTVTAGSATDGLSYFCRATLSDFVTTVDSKPVSMDVREIVAAKAIVAEEVNFTYNYEGAAAYQWFVRAKGAAAYTAVDGAVQARLSLTAELAFSGAEYYCAAYDAKGAELGKSSIYTYEIPLYAAYDVNSCVGHDLCKYVAELANMSREERYAVMTGAWAETAVNNTTLAELVQDHWAAMHAEVYPTLLCTCTNMKAADASHSAHCPWRTDAKTSTNERAEVDPCKAYAGLLPDGVLCAYEHLKGLGSHEARFAYITALQAEDPAAYQSYYAAYKAHGAHDLLCSCGQLTVAPGADHVATCAWQLPAQTVADCVIGTELTLKAFNDLADKTGYTFRWVDGEGNILAPAANPWELAVTAAYEAKTYRCDAILNNQVVSSQGYVIESQTEELDDYVAFLWDFYTWEGDTEVLDKASVYAWMTGPWNIRLADGTNLAENVLKCWAEAWQADSADLLCTCVLNGVKHSEHCLLAPDALHAVECPWAGEMNVVENAATGITVTGDIPEGVTLAVTAATGPMPEIDLTHFDITGIYPLMRSYNITLLNEDGSKYVVPEGTTVEVAIPGVYPASLTNPIVDVYHTRDDATVDYMTSMSGEVRLMADGSIRFETDGFSVYTVMVGAKEIGVMSNGDSHDISMALGASVKIGPYYNENFTFEISNENVASATFGNQYVTLSLADGAAIGDTATVTMFMSVPWAPDNISKATVNITVVKEEKEDASNINATITVESGKKETSWLQGGEIIQLYMAPDTAVKINGSGFGNANVEITHWKGSNVSAAQMDNTLHVLTLSGAQAGDQAKILVTDKDTGAFKAVIYVDVIAEKIPEQSDNDPKVEVGSAQTSNYFPDGSVARYKMAPDTTAIVACGSNNLEAVSSMPDIVSAAVGSDGKTLYITTASTATPADTATAPAKVMVRDKDTKIVKGIVYIDVIDAPDFETISYTGTYTVDLINASVNNFNNGGVYKYNIAPGLTATSANYGDVTVRADDASIVNARIEDGKLLVTANETAQIGQKTRIIVKDNATNAVVTTIFVEIVKPYTPPTAADKLKSDEYPVQIAIRNDGVLPSEPSIYDSSPYTYFTSALTVGSPSDHYRENAEGVIDPDLLNHEKFYYVSTDGKQVIGMYDATGDACKQFLSGINWDTILTELLGREGINCSYRDGDGVLHSEPIKPEDADKYEVIPYVIKCQETDGKGWHIDCAVVRKDAVTLFYDFNLPAGMTINTTENSKVGLPNNEKGVSPAKFTVGKISGMTANTEDNSEYIIVNPDYTFAFVEWNTKADGSGTSYQPNGSITISKDTTLYAIWSITPELGTGNLKVRKFVDDTAADAAQSYTFRITIPPKDDDADAEYDYILYGKDNVAITDDDGNVVGGKLSNGDTFTLKNEQYIIITGLPTSEDGSVVTVTETEPNGYEPVWTGGTANGAATSIAITDGAMSELVCTNTVVTISESELTVTKAGLSNGDSALVQVNVTHNNSTDTYLLALNANNNPQTITGLTVGATYTVTELNGWTWEYADTSAISGTIDADAKENQVTVNNTKNTETWMHDESAVQNEFSNTTKKELNNQ